MERTTIASTAIAQVVERFRVYARAVKKGMRRNAAFERSLATFKEAVAALNHNPKSQRVIAVLQIAKASVSQRWSEISTDADRILAGRYN